ncbi:hypothetical protein L917_06644 [Phytophthora nicotianae]|uniref:Uncharacterized protein n=1 Tax=Phytophthora nicotianae TaxID=4792 RepID=W2LFX4_PHYNI|nr:hypothetical protein L917_06644 [Phytophthora nicotianae]
MASNSGSSDSVIGYSTSSSRTNSDLDTCAYYGLEPGETCFTHRSCYDCLNVPVATDPEGCVLSQFGYCMSMVFYDYTLDYRVTTGPNADSGSPYNFSGGLYHQYPAVNTTYCEATDPACVECNAIALNYSRQDNFLARSTKFCLGESDCVCVLSCEPTVWALRTVSLCDDADSSSIAASNSDSSTSWTPFTTSPSIIVNRTSSNMTNLYWVLAVPGFIVLLVAHYFIRLKFNEYRRRQLLRIPRRSPRTRLRLSAWRALQEDLIGKEKEPVDSAAFHIEPITGAQEE